MLKNATTMLCVMCAVSLLGCGVARSTVARTDGRTPSTFRPGPNRALVFFVGKSFRTAREADNGVRLADEDGRLVGELGPGNWLVKDVEPGRRCWYAWLEVYANASVAALCGELKAGRSYFVRVGQRNAYDWGGALGPAWQVGTMFDLDQDPRRGLVYDPKLARDTEKLLSVRIASAVREGKDKVAAGDFVVLADPPAWVDHTSP
jgi:hypothetical protein